MRRFMVLILVVCFLGACGGKPTPAPDLVATQIAVEEAAHATMTAKAPTPTSVPVATAIPPQLWKTANSKQVSQLFTI